MLLKNIKNIKEVLLSHHVPRVLFNFINEGEYLKSILACVRPLALHLPSIKMFESRSSAWLEQSGSVLKACGCGTWGYGLGLGLAGRTVGFHDLRRLFQ